MRSHRLPTSLLLLLLALTGCAPADDDLGPDDTSADAATSDDGTIAPGTDAGGRDIGADAAADVGPADDGGADTGASLPEDANGVKDGTETDVDCGGSAAPKCVPGKACIVADDCAEGVCGAAKPNVCDAPSYADGVQNGTETDVDCGGDPAHRCAVDQKCAAHADCASNGCSYAGKCAPRASCTAKDGGDTCLKDDGTTESCCKGIAVPSSTYSGAAFTIDKYLTTAGRMRAFLTRVDGDVRGYITANKPSWWEDEWTPWLPVSWNGHVDNDYGKPIVPTTVKGWSPGEYTVSGSDVTPTVPAHDLVVRHVNVASAWAQVGGGVIFDQGSQGCFIGSGGYGHPTYLVPKADATALYGDDYDRWISQAALDQRPINCTNWPVLAALCAFDGGRLINEKQYAVVYDDDGAVSSGKLTGGRSTYPWGTPPAMTCAGGICTPGAGYDKVKKPHVGGYAFIDPPDVAGTAKAWTIVGPGGQTGFSKNVCRECVDDWVNWQFSYQDPLWDPYAAGLAAAEQDRRARDQSYFISVPGTFPKGASRPFGGDRVQDIAGLMYEAAIPSSGTYTTFNAYVSFGTEQKTDDVAVLLPKVLIYGGSFEGHLVGASGSYRLVTKYGKMTARCVY